MKLDEADRQLAAAWETYGEQVNRIALATLREVVWPVLKRRHYTLASGMGHYVVSDRDGRTVELDPDIRRITGMRPDAALAEIFAVLEQPIPGDPYPLGTLGHEYPETERKSCP